MHETQVKPHLHCANDLKITNYNEILSTAMYETQVKAHLQCGTDPGVIRK